MNFTLTIDLSTPERSAVSAALFKLAADGTVNDFEYTREGVYWIDATDISACGRAREHEVEQEIAATIAKAVIGAAPTARFMIELSVEHCCSGCDHCCDDDEVVWSTDRPPTPEERAVFAIAMTDEAAT